MSSSLVTSRRPFKSSDIQLYCYTAPTSQGAFGRNEYGAIAEQVTWTNSESGGYTEASFRIYLPGRMNMPPELDMFSRVIIQRAGDIRFIGEIDDSELWMQNKQSFIQVHALGLGNAMRDDPASFSYSSVTLQQIGQDQITSRINGTGSSYTFDLPGPISNIFVGVIDPDTSQIFPDNPAGTWAPAYDRKTPEEVFTDITTFGSTNGVIYVWGSEAHPVNRDSFGFPTLRMFIRQRDAYTTHYIASVAAGDIDQYNFGRNAQYAYNIIDVDYTDQTTTPPSLNFAEGQQLVNLVGTNPAQNHSAFRARRLSRDYTGVSTVGTSQASTIAGTYVEQYAYPSNKGTVQLRAVRDASGNAIPLDAVLAGKNILIPDLAMPLDTANLVNWAAVQPLGTMTTTPIPGQNQFHIVSAQWQEDNQGPYMTVQLDNFVDRAANLVAKLMLSADVRARSTKTGTFVFGPGVPDTVTGGGTTITSAGGQTVSWAFTWHAQMARPPTSATTSTISLVNGVAASETINHLTQFGGAMQINSTAAGAVTWLAYVTSHGNTLHRIGRYDITWHCRQCNKKHEKLSIKKQVYAWAGLENDPQCGKPGTSALSVTCPDCGMKEHFNTAVRAPDGLSRSHDALQRQLIRQLMAHPQIKLEVA